MHAARISNPRELHEIQASEQVPAVSDRVGGPPETTESGARADLPARTGDRGRFVLRRAGLSCWLAPRSSATRYVLALVFVVAAYLVTILLETGTGKFTSFPFYAAVVAGAWLGVGPGLLSFALSAVVAADFWTPARFSLEIPTVDLPSFAAFVVFALMSLAWSMQRRRAQYALEQTVQKRTAELVEANAALKAEMAEREATERALRDAEAELARTLRLATMAELAATIAHEINQPLAAIEANASAGLQWMSGPSASAREYVREILMDISAAAHRATAVIQRTIDLFSRQPAGRGPVHLHDLVDSALTTTAVALRRGAVAVSTNVPADLPPVHADRGMLLQVIISLISNATEAMHPVAGRAIFVDAGVTSDGVLQLHLEDTGPGIDPENLENVFKPFHTSKAGHIGIGLSISRAIIEAHGGALKAMRASKEGSGARFQITLPAIGAPRRARE